MRKGTNTVYLEIQTIKLPYFIIAMKIYLILIIFNIFGVKTQSKSIMETFLHADISHVILCSEDSTDDTLEYLQNIINRKNIWIYYWNCAREEIPPIHNGLMILNDVQPKIFKRLLTLQGIQNSLASNLWIIQVPSSVQDLEEYFSKNKLKLSLNIQIFFMKSIKEQNSVVQALGLGKYQPKFEVGQMLIMETCLDI